MKANLYVGNKRVIAEGTHRNEYVRSVQAAFRMQATINEDVRVELVV